VTTRDPALQGGLFLLPLLLYLGKAATRLLLTARPVLGMSFLSAGFIALFRTVIREQHAVMAMVAGMLDGLVQFHTRKEEEVKEGMRTDTRRYKKMTSHRYLQHTAFTAGPGDQVVGQDSYDIELRHDFLLRKYEYQRALDQVLMPYVVRKKPEYKFSLLMELLRRKGLVHIADLLLELFLPKHGMSGRVDGLFKQLRQRLKNETAYCE